MGDKISVSAVAKQIEQEFRAKAGDELKNFAQQDLMIVVFATERLAEFSIEEFAIGASATQELAIVRAILFNMKVANSLRLSTLLVSTATSVVSTVSKVGGAVLSGFLVGLAGKV